MLAAGLRSLGAVLLCLVVLLSGGWSLRPRPESPPSAGSSPSGRLREVPPPKASQALRLRLAEHQPRLRVLAPADDAVLPAGPWSLQLELEDWPLTDAGSLGLGAHLVVQLDDQEPIRLGTDPAQGAEGTAPIERAGAATLSTVMPPLAPGSHRLTVYAAQPWGEAVKDPGASSQIRLHGLAANPLSQPRRGTPQLVSSTPTDLIHREPVLIDWLLIDAPLQSFDGAGPRWRLRVTLNGDSFLVDRQSPLWLSGLHPGSNPLQLELLDGLGEPLNPPFNSRVQDLVMLPGAPRPWQTAALAAEDLERLLGERPIEAESEVEPEPEPEQEQEPEPEPEPEPRLNPEPEAPAQASPESEALETSPQPEPEADAADAPEPEEAVAPGPVSAPQASSVEAPEGGEPEEASEQPMTEPPAASSLQPSSPGDEGDGTSAAQGLGRLRARFGG